MMDSLTFQVMYMPIQDVIYLCLYQATRKCYVSGEGLWDQGGGGGRECMEEDGRNLYNYFWIVISQLDSPTNELSI